MKKRIFASLLAALSASALFASAAAASDIKFNINNTKTAPTADGVITVEEYAGNAPLVFDGSGKNTESGWDANTQWAEHVFNLYYTWDMDNLYVGITVEGEKTAAQDSSFDKPTACYWSKADMMQLGFNPGMMISGNEPLYICIAFTADGQPGVHGDAYQSKVDGEQSIHLEDVVKGYSKAYSAEGINYCAELAIPWDKIMVDGVCRSNQGAKLYEMSGELAKIGDGYELPIMMLYRDKDAKQVYRTAAASTNYSNDAKDMFPLKLVLTEVADEPVEPEASPSTADGASLALAALAVSALGAGVVAKKRK
ncbi:MAG: hypothetical protein E7632_04680 [Ruminococcaceae bacterium]|nr:hypothetical protein [Oscillospiraceae bacterium]